MLLPVGSMLRPDKTCKKYKNYKTVSFHWYFVCKGLFNAKTTKAKNTFVVFIFFMGWKNYFP
jgi:hypothetical protein